MNRINFLPPWVETTLQPAFYDKESGTVLQQTARMYAKVNQLVRNVNEQNEAIELYIAKFIELSDYVHDYFDNLDVQEEINNKLDDMVEQGVLQEIIGDYLDATAVWGFDSIADMKSSTNLINGSFARTLGYNTKNDCGGGFYKIRTITNEDVVDEGKIVSLSDDTLIAELIIDGYVTPEQFGCYGDNTHDDTTNLQKALDSGFEVHTFNNYKISNTINVNDSLIMSSDSFIHFTSGVTGLGVGVAHTLGRQMINKTYKINVDAHGYSSVAVGFGMPKKCDIDVYVNNAGTTGIKANYYNDNGNNENRFNFHVNGNTSGTTTYGVYWNGYDSTIEDLITRDCKYGVYLDHGELVANHIHCWLSESTVATLWTGSSCIHTNGGYNVTVNWLYQDSMQYGVDGSGIYGTVNFFEYNNAFDTSTYTGMVNVYFPDNAFMLLVNQFKNDKDQRNLITYDNHNAYKNSMFGVTGINGSLPFYQQNTYHAEFTDCDLAPQICSKYCKYDVTNLPISTNGCLTSEVVGNIVKQTFTPANVGTVTRIWIRYRTYDSTTWSDWKEYQPYTAP